MVTLPDLLSSLCRRPGVLGAVLVSRDGLPIDSAGEGDAEALAALAVSLLRQAERVADATERGALRQGVLELAQGVVIFAPVGPEGLLLVLAEPERDLGTLLHDLRRHRPALAALL